MNPAGALLSFPRPAGDGYGRLLMVLCVLAIDKTTTARLYSFKINLQHSHRRCEGQLMFRCTLWKRQQTRERLGVSIILVLSSLY